MRGTIRGLSFDLAVLQANYVIDRGLRGNNAFRTLQDESVALVDSVRVFWRESSNRLGLSYGKQEIEVVELAKPFQKVGEDLRQLTSTRSREGSLSARNDGQIEDTKAEQAGEQRTTNDGPSDEFEGELAMPRGQAKAMPEIRNAGGNAGSASELGRGLAVKSDRQRRGRRLGAEVDAAHLKQFRGDLSQVEFAEKCDVSLDSIQRGEGGGRWSDKTFEAVAATITILTGKSVKPEDLKNRRK